MQRKNYLLGLRTSGSTLTSGKLFFTKKVPSRQARGFAMIMAIIVLIVIATISMFTLMQTSRTVKSTADMYMYEQAQLYTKSAIEYTLFEIARNGCLNNNVIFTLDGMYDINVTTSYSYVGGVPAGSGCASFATVTTDKQNGSVLMDIAVSVPSSKTGSDPIRYFRRTIQKL